MFKTRTQKLVALLAAVALTFGAGIAFAQVTKLAPVTVVGHLLSAGPPPTFGAGCGSTASASVTTAGDLAVQMTASGAGQAATCVVTFGGTYTNAPACIAVDNTTAAKNPILVTTTTTAATLTPVTSLAANDVVSIVCVGFGPGL